MDIQTVAWYHYDKGSGTLNVIKHKMVDILTIDGHPERQIDMKVEIVMWMCVGQTLNYAGFLVAIKHFFHPSLFNYYHCACLRKPMDCRIEIKSKSKLFFSSFK